MKCEDAINLRNPRNRKNMPPKKVSGWANLSLAFEDFGESIPKKKEKKQSPIEETFFAPEVSVLRRNTNIQSLSALIEECNPRKCSDLSVSKQKQNEIKDWFVNDVQAGKPNLLVITGPSGCGKTSAFKVIAEENGYEVVEWTTPTDSVASENCQPLRQGDKFLEFLVRATRYNSVLQKNSRRLLLVKDIPNVYFVKTENFITMLNHYYQYGNEPLVFICTDGGSSRPLKTLFPSSVRERFGINVITVNSATQTAMKNMLKRVSVILNTRASHMINVTQHNIDEVLSNSIGDVRSTVLNLIFNSLKVPDSTSKKECESREESLGLLHGIGRVINAKRIQNGDSWKFVHDPDEIASYFQSQSTVFLHFLHENYVNTMGAIEDIEICADILSLSDTIAYEWRDASLNNLNLSYCIRGIMVTNKKPVTGWNPVRKPRTEEVTVQRNLGAAEERWYKSIICPKVSDVVLDLENTVIERNSDTDL